MEHRYHSRVPSDIRMLIYRFGLPVATGRIRNISRIGLFVETDYDELHQHQKLECEFCVDEERGRIRHRLGAYVSRCGEQGLGLELDDGDESSNQVLGSLMHADVMTS